MNNKYVCDCDVIHEETVNTVKEQMLPLETLEDVTVLYKLLGDKTRFGILWALSKSVMCVCDIAILLDMTKSAISHQLKSLKHANLVTSRRKGKVVFYSLADKSVVQILDMCVAHANEATDDERI